MVKEHALDGMVNPMAKVKLMGTDGNAIAILIAVEKAILAHEYKDAQTGKVYNSEDVVKEFNREAKSGDYNHLMRTVFQYCDVS